MSDNTPRKISYTDKDVADAAKFDRYREGWYALLLKAMDYVSSEEKGHLMYKCQYAALTDPNDAGSAKGPKLFRWQCLPFRNPERADHQPLKMFGRTTNNWLAAHLPKPPDDGPLKGKFVPEMPRKNKESGEYVYLGDVLDKDLLEEKNKEALDLTYEVASAMIEDESHETENVILDTRIFAYISYKDGSDFPNIDRLCAELPEGAELLPPEQWFTAPEEAGEPESEETKETEEAKPAPKLVKPSPSKKPTPKAAAKGGKKK